MSRVCVNRLVAEPDWRPALMRNRPLFFARWKRFRRAALAGNGQLTKNGSYRERVTIGEETQ